MYASIALWIWIVIGILFVGVVVLFMRTYALTKKLRTFMQGADAQSLETTIEHLIETHSHHETCLGAHKKALEQLDARVQQRLKTPQLIRFNALGDGGNEQSFTTAFLDEKGNGYLLSAIAHRNHVGLYTKKVEHFKAESTLTEEETNLLAQSV